MDDGAGTTGRSKEVIENTRTIMPFEPGPKNATCKYMSKTVQNEFLKIAADLPIFIENISDNVSLCAHIIRLSVMK